MNWKSCCYVLCFLLCIVHSQEYPPYYDYYDPQGDPRYQPGYNNPYDYYNPAHTNAESVRYDPRDSDPVIVIRPRDTVPIEWGENGRVYSICSVAGVEEFSFNWVRRLPDNSIQVISPTAELYIDNVRPEDVAHPIFCRVTRLRDGSTFEKQLSVTSQQWQPLAGSNVELKLTIEPLPAEDLDQGKIMRRCHFDNQAELDNKFDFRWIDQNGRVINNGDTLYLMLENPIDLGNYTCEATNRQSGTIYQARYRVLREATISRETARNIEYTVETRPTTTEVLIGQPYTMTCQVTPQPSEPVVYRWYHRGRIVGSDSRLTLPALNFGDLGKYTCSAQWAASVSRGGSLVANSTLQLNLELTQANEIDLDAPPGSMMVTMKGVFKELHCEYETRNPRQVIWYFEGDILERHPELNATGHISRIDRQLVSIIAINGTEDRHEGDYKCIVDDVIKQAHLIIRGDIGLTVNPPTQTVNVGEAAEIHCRIDGAIEKNRDLEWFFRRFLDDQILPLELDRPGSFQRDDNDRATLTTFISTLNARKIDEGEYICRHPPTGIEQRATLYVIERSVQRIYITPSIVRVRVNQAISVECYITDEAGNPVSSVPMYRLRDSRVQFETSQVATNRMRLDISRGLSRDYNGTEIECYSQDQSTSVTATIHIEDTCQAGQRRCRSGECLMAGRFCDGVPDCSDGSDEDRIYCDVCDPISKKCENFNGQPPTSSTYMVHWACDDENDCGNNFDESSCSEHSRSKCSEERFRCQRGGNEIPRSFVCDKDKDCSYGEDEENCSPPVIEAHAQYDYRVRVGTQVSITCRVNGNPLPHVIWRFNWGCLPDEGSRFRVQNVAENCNYGSPSVVSTLTITDIRPGDDGIYNCEGLFGLNRALSNDYRVMLDY